MKKINSLEEIFLVKIQALYDIENQTEQALRKMEQTVVTPELREVFRLHIIETEEHSNRLEKIFNIFNIEPEDIVSEGIRGIIVDIDWVIEADVPPQLKDLMICAAARYAEHYEMAGYLSAIVEAQLLKMPDVVEMLSQTLLEEDSADKSLAYGMKNIAKKIQEDSEYNTRESLI